MSLRFRRRVRILPGVYLNLSRSGVSASVGIRGASMTLGQDGVYANLGIPGSGLSHRSRIDGKGTSTNKAERPSARSAGKRPEGAYSSTSAPANPGADASRDRTQQAQVYIAEISTDQPALGRVELHIDTSGHISLVSNEGHPLPERDFKLLRRRTPEPFRDAMAEYVAMQEALLAALLDLHTQTPDPERRQIPEARRFPVPEPDAPRQRPQNLLTRLLPWKRRRFEAGQAQALKNFEAAHARWTDARARHVRAEKARIDAYVKGLESADPEVSEQALAKRLSALEWPRETDVSFEFGPHQTCLTLDVDLPELEALPTLKYGMPKRQWRILTKEFSTTEQQDNYARHVHAVVFRLLGEVFACLPRVTEVRVAGYTQRIDPATAVVRDDYVIAVVAARADWEAIDFGNLAALDPVKALERFGLTREMSARGALARIGEPDWTP